MIRFRTIGDFARYLGTVGELHRVTVEVDPHLEMTEIATRAVREQKPAILFENVRGSGYPVLINALATERRCELALQKDPSQLGQELIRFVEEAMPPSPSMLFRQRKMVSRFLHSFPRRTSAPLSQEVVEEADLDTLPVLTCWPDDGGPFFTLPQVVTYDPRTGKRNIGIYRLQRFSKNTTGMHWQIQKGGGFHYAQAEKLGKELEVAVALGTDPALLLATVAALPENIDEAMFAGFLRGSRTRFAKGKTISIDVPADAEFVIEGVVPPGERRREGPFGDHFGHYSHAAEFPVFYAKAMTRRRDAIYPATVVGIPPQEDKYLGDTTQHILGPLIRTLHSEITDLWAYYEAGFHNLLVVAVDQRYGKEAMKTALGLFGTGQLSLSKSIILVSSGVNVRDFGEVIRNVGEHFDPHEDFVLIPRVPMDTLDFTSYTMNLGSKMIIDATRKRERGVREEGRGKTESQDEERISHLKGIDRRILDMRLVSGSLLLVKVKSHGKEIVQKLVQHTELAGVRMIAAVSEDVNLNDRENYIWGIFTRFDCARDILFTEQKLVGISPVYKGMMGVDATWKKGYPEVLRMTDEIVNKVEQRWEDYWR
ncbi:MAG: menaquinone biosynthesis decarboxylase [Ignavibacteria bacterium]|nr:menaquinone biosynthesis decarboxylase [Ignavibacteria bacterium]